MMRPIDRILVPHDGSEHAEAALEAIGPFLEIRQPEVILLGVGENGLAADKLRILLRRSCDALAARGVDASVAVRGARKPAPTILEFAAERGADMIAMSTHGRGGLARVFMGSVAEEVLRHSEVPVFVCRPGARAGDWKRILVALDGSERAEEILPDAAAIARAGKAAVDLVRVTFPIVASAGQGEVPTVLPAEDPTPYLQQVCGRLLAEGVDARPVGLEGRAAAELLTYAKKSRAGLLCMTTHGRSGVGRVLLGSIAEEILRNSPCPVLLRRMAAAPKLAPKA